MLLIRGSHGHGGTEWTPGALDEVPYLLYPYLTCILQVSSFFPSNNGDQFLASHLPHSFFLFLSNECGIQRGRELSAVSHPNKAELCCYRFWLLSFLFFRAPAPLPVCLVLTSPCLQVPAHHYPSLKPPHLYTRPFLDVTIPAWIHGLAIVVLRTLHCI